MPENQIKNQTIRGAIKVDVNTSTTNLVAGEEFSLFIKVFNPFEVPISLTKVSAFFPTEFIDIDLLQREQQIREIENELESINELAKENGIGVKGLKGLSKNKKFLNFLNKIRIKSFFFDFEMSNPNSGPILARNTGGVKSKVGVGLPFIGNIEYEVSRGNGNEVDKEKLKEKIDKEVNEYLDVIKELRKAKDEPTFLQPGNSTTSVFTVKSKKNMLFKPSQYNINIEVEYEIENRKNNDTIGYNFKVRSSQGSIILGALLGSLAGGLIKQGESIVFSWTASIQIISTMLISVMSIVLLSRKNEVQTIISVEDFWGGIGIGFLIAYSGTDVIGSVTSTA